MDRQNTSAPSAGKRSPPLFRLPLMLRPCAGGGALQPAARGGIQAGLHPPAQPCAQVAGGQPGQEPEWGRVKLRWAWGQNLYNTLVDRTPSVTRGRLAGSRRCMAGQARRSSAPVSIPWLTRPRPCSHGHPAECGAGASHRGGLRCPPDGADWRPRLWQDDSGADHREAVVRSAQDGAHRGPHG